MEAEYKKVIEAIDERISRANGSEGKEETELFINKIGATWENKVIEIVKPGTKAALESAQKRSQQPE